MNKFIKYSVGAVMVTMLSACSDGRASSKAVTEGITQIESIAQAEGSISQATYSSIQSSPVAETVAINSSQHLAQSDIPESKEKCWFSRK